ncbi:uncharacterized protein ACIB01_009300 [Guaruba guarouba]
MCMSGLRLSGFPLHSPTTTAAATYGLPGALSRRFADVLRVGRQGAPRGRHCNGGREARPVLPIPRSTVRGRYGDKALNCCVAEARVRCRVGNGDSARRRGRSGSPREVRPCPGPPGGQTRVVRESRPGREPEAVSMCMCFLNVTVFAQTRLARICGRVAIRKCAELELSPSQPSSCTGNSGKSSGNGVNEGGARESQLPTTPSERQTYRGDAHNAMPTPAFLLQEICPQE